MPVDKQGRSQSITSRQNQRTYILISPAKDEEKHIETTIRAVLKQTVRPFRWIIVDDGSQDKTAKIVEEYAKAHPWIQVVAINRDVKRGYGSAEIRAFTAGYRLIENERSDFVVKLDSDLDLPPDYFERLLARFNEDPTLGIASGIYLEKHANEWVAIKMPCYHASGASKVIRWQGFRDIGGFVSMMGWDTLDEIRAQMKGWKTQHFTEIQFYHLRTEGAAAGLVNMNKLQGQGYYLTGGGLLFFAFKVMHRIILGKPFLIGGLALLWGFLKSWSSRRERIVNEDESQYYRRLLNRRLFNSVESLVKRAKPEKAEWGLT